jgi:hypothetical protein
MLEAELEAAICRAFAILLQDLHAEGYRIVSSQAVLVRRRIDLILRKADHSACIIEIKVGAPGMPAVRDQILDYASCWKAAFPTERRPRLIVISNRIPDRTKAELANFGIESRVISESSALDALLLTDERPPVGVNLTPNEATEEIRRLLSDFDAVKAPADLLLSAPWDHEKVFLALVKRGERHKDLWLKNIYVTLYGQKPNCAVLYGPKASWGQGPLHLRPGVASWNAGTFDRIRPHIKFKVRELKPAGFDEYVVTDWNGLAAGLNLDQQG